MVPWIKKGSVCAVSSTRFAQSFSQTMRSYNTTENLDRLRERPSEVEKGTATDASNLSAKKEIPFEPVAVTQTKESPLKNYLFAAFAFVILLSLILFFNINVIVLIIGAILIVALMLLMS